MARLSLAPGSRSPKILKDKNRRCFERRALLLNLQKTFFKSKCSRYDLVPAQENLTLVASFTFTTNVCFQLKKRYCHPRRFVVSS